MPGGELSQQPRPPLNFGFHPMFETLTAELTTPFRSMPAEVAALRLIVAVLLGGIIGLERELASRPAGLRTHMLIALAACLFTIITFEMLALPGFESADSKSDPLRLIEAVTAGVAFLAAGTIVISGGQVNGLTTGAGMWLAGAIGLACGIGHLPLAAMSTVVALIVLSLIGWLSARIANETDAKSATAGKAAKPRQE
jgi:putative Mg2+ transporter-C (MgtC) family protein